MDIEQERNKLYLNLQRNEEFGIAFEILVGSDFSHIGFGNIQCTSPIERCILEFDGRKILYFRGEYTNKQLLCVDGILNRYRFCSVKSSTLKIIVSLPGMDYDTLPKEILSNMFLLNIKLKNKKFR